MLKRIGQWKSKSPEGPVPEEVIFYNQLLRQNHYLDFDDLLCEAVSLLTTEAEVLAETQRRYPFIFVDEYQDINSAQHALLKILAGKQVTLTAIGDPNQAIYGFRGSDVKFFESFTRDFEGTGSFSLTENYRSAANLLKASEEVIAKNNPSGAASLIARSERHGRLIIHETLTDKSEAEYVVQKIEKLVGGLSLLSYDSRRLQESDHGRYCFADIAVLYRLNAENQLLKKALDRQGIPYQSSGEKRYPLTDEGYEYHVDKVSLLTLHAAKGLEFAVVFILGCEENLLPLSLEGFELNNQEERCLFYVGMTRAKECLYLINAKRRFLFGQLMQNKVSVFVEDIAESLKEYDRVAVKERPREKQLMLFSPSSAVGARVR